MSGFKKKKLFYPHIRFLNKNLPSYPEFPWLADYYGTTWFAEGVDPWRRIPAPLFLPHELAWLPTVERISALLFQLQLKIEKIE